MLLFSVAVLAAAVLLLGVSIAIYRGRIDLIHEYHRTKATDPKAYGKSFAKALLVMVVSLVLSGILGLFDRLSVCAVAVLIIGLCIGIASIAIVQRKYNKGLF